MRSRSAIEFQDVVAATYVVGLDLISADFTSIQQAIDSLPAAGGHIYVLNGTYTIATPIVGTIASVTIGGGGKGNTIISYTPATGDAFTWGSASVSLGNSHFSLRDLTISTGTSGAALVILRLQDYLLINVEVLTNGQGTGLKISGSNSGDFINVDSRSNVIGIDFVTVGGDSGNLNIFIGGQITNNTTAIRAIGTHVENQFQNCNISANFGSPAVLLEQAIGWVFFENFFEANFGGANTYTISLGTALLPADANLFDSNFFEEANGVTYGVRVVRATHTVFINNNVNTGITGALVRLEAQAAYTFGFGNSSFNNFLTTLSDASATRSTTWIDTFFTKFPYNIAYTPVTFTQIVANQNNYALSNARICRMSTDASRNITGFVAGLPGECKKIVNVGSFNIVLTNLDGSSAAANQILTGTGTSLTITPSGVLNLFYDDTTAKWRVE